jgi:DNA-binding XRE family transcriptional regulator
MQPSSRYHLRIERACCSDATVVAASAGEGGLYRAAGHNRAGHAGRDVRNSEYIRTRSRRMPSRRGRSGYRRLTTLRLVCDASVDTPNDGAAATYYDARRTVGRKALFDVPREARPPGTSVEGASGVRVGRRLYWSGAAHQPRREGTVVAVYHESRGGSAPLVLVIDVRWDPPPASERPRGPLSLGIPVARIGTAGWGWVDEPPPLRSADAWPNVAINSGDQLGLALPKRFGIAVRRIRESQGLSQERLAIACGLHRTFVGAVERGETNVSLSTLGRLAKGLGVSVSHLAAEAESAGDRR